MRHYFLHLRTPTGLEAAFAPLPFADMEAAYLDACAAIPSAAADLLRMGQDPMLCAFMIHDADDRLLEEVPFADVLRPGTGRSPPRRASRADPALVWRRTAALIAQSRATCARARRLSARAAELAGPARGAEPPSPRPPSATQGYRQEAAKPRINR